MNTTGTQPRISIVMPSYNQAAYLEEAILSVLGQDYPNCELIVLDGGSTDGSLDIVEKYRGNFGYWHSRPDHGQIDALMQGFAIATGELLGWVNSDDVLLPGALRALAAAHSRKPRAGIIGGRYILIDQLGKVVRCKRHTSQARMFAKLGLVVINQPGSLFTREAFDQVGGFDPKLDWVMDSDLYFRILNGGFSYAHVDRWLSAFRIHSRAKTTAQRDIAVSEGRQAMADRFSGKWNYRARSVIAQTAYQVWQLSNGNHLRAAVESLDARGSGWQLWAASHCPVLDVPTTEL